MASRKGQRKEKILSAGIGGLDAKEPVHIYSAGEAHSDSEALNYRGPYYQLATSLPDSKSVYSPLTHAVDAGNYTDDDDPRVNEFVDGGLAHKLLKSGRQRKKLAARTKGGEFQTKRRKRRIYWCCISSEIDVQKLSDYLHGADDLLFDWKFELYSDVLHIYKPGADETASAPIAVGGKPSASEEVTPRAYSNMTALSSVTSNNGISLENYLRSKREKNSSFASTTATAAGSGAPQSAQSGARGVSSTGLEGTPIFRQESVETEKQEKPRLLSVGAREVFVFDFGAVVFWGFPRGEEAGLLKTIRMFATKGMVGSAEFQSGEDDMAFVPSAEDKEITVANDVVTLPDETEPKQRLAVSFAIAQSSVLAIFEARIEQKVEEYKYIPETLAAVGKVHLSERQLGMMIGEVFVIRHDVNLHTEILDTPDFFWKEKAYEGDYKLVSSYLEMQGRTEILNKRLDMLRELLDVLQQQMENAHGVKLEWIVIYLIVAEVVLQGLAIICK